MPKGVFQHKPLSEEHKNKIAEGLKKYYSVNESKSKGRRHTEEWKQKISQTHPKYWLGKKRSLEDRKKMSLARKGKKGHPMSDENKRKLSLLHLGKPRLDIRGKRHWWWKGGVCESNKAIRKSLQYEIWRRAVFERDNYTCIWCGIRSKPGVKVYLEADHIKPFCDYPELRFAIDNGRTLCRECHMKTDTFLRDRNKLGRFVTRCKIKAENI